MRKYIKIFILFIVCSFALIACSDSENEANESGNKNNNTENNNLNQKENDNQETMNIPDDVILDAEADPIELEDQAGLEIGETGYAVRHIESGELAITLNGVEKTQEISDSETKEGDEFYMIGDFTFENVGNDRLKTIRPDASKASDEAAILNDELDNSDILGLGNDLGGYYVGDDNKIDEDTHMNDIALEPGEKIDQKTAISMEDSADEYLIVFGFYDGKNKYYENKVAWTFGSNQIK